jgi:Ni,Fe-hydrogenase III large subunit/Ni,Fe-hydrogenase III component G
MVKQRKKRNSTPQAPMRKTNAKVGKANEKFVDATEASFAKILAALTKDHTLISLFCEERFAANPFTLFYVFEKETTHDITIVKRPCTLKGVETISRKIPAALWYEREITDGFGIPFIHAFDSRRLFLHESYPADFHPLHSSVRNKRPLLTTAIGEGYVFKHLEGEGVYQIPVGPVHAGIIEPGHFRFSVIGETVFNLEVRMFYKHRGLEKLAEGKKPEDCQAIAESISGDETIANAYAFLQAVEKISQMHVPLRAMYLRMLFLEMERIYSLLSDLAGMIIDVAYPAGASPLFILREEILRHNHHLTGSRFMKGALALGGVAKEVPSVALSELAQYLPSFKNKLTKIRNSIKESPLVIDRFETTGIVKPELIKALNITGPIARASGSTADVRIDHPYALYQKYIPTTTVRTEGDVASRFDVKTEDILVSVHLISQLLKDIPKGIIQQKAKIRDGYALSLVESPRGQNMHWLHLHHGKVKRYKIRTASFCNWQAIEHTVPGNIVPDFPLINKSFNLSYAGTDL